MSSSTHDPDGEFDPGSGDVEGGQPSAGAGTRQDSREADARPDSSLGLGTLPERFVLIYPIVFILPFPLYLLGLLDVIPGFSGSFFKTASDWLIGLHGQAVQPIVGALGRWFTGETPSFEFTGSGDGLASYLDALFDFTLAAVLALIWWFRRRSAPISPRVADACRVFLRYFLAWIMLSYGFSKVFPLQFSMMGPARQLQPYGDSSPMGLLWTFMGASPGYQMFAGAGEVLGGLLLLFRRTTLIGALVIAAVMTNVFALNMFFDVPVKLYSFHYLIFALFLAIPDVPRLFGLFVANVPVGARDLRPFWWDSPRKVRVFAIAKAVLIVALLWSNIDSRLESMRSWGPWAQKHELRGFYRVESFELSAPESEDPSARAIPDEVRWVRVGMSAPRGVTLQRADGSTSLMRMRIDEEASTVAIYDRALLEPSSDPLSLERLEDGRLRLEGVFEDLPIAVTLERDDTERLFYSRHFRWISEVPYNR